MRARFSSVVAVCLGKGSVVSKGRRRAFTLVELLVVVAIIALLLAILLPALSRARHAAKTTVCLTSLRQIGTAARLYQNDEGVMPQAQNFNFFADGTLNPSMSHTTASKEYVTFSLQLAPYAGSNVSSHLDLTGILRGCPLFRGMTVNELPDGEPTFEDTGYNSTKTGYGLNIFFEYAQSVAGSSSRRNIVATWASNPSSSDARPAYYTMEQATNPAQRTFIGDSNEIFMHVVPGGNADLRITDGSFPDDFGKYRWWDPARHGWGDSEEVANYMMYDGHAETLDFERGLESQRMP